MAIEIPNALIAYGRVNADGTKASGAGFTSKKAAKGSYTLTLDGDGVPAAESMAICTPYAAAVGALEADYTDTSDTVKTVSTGAAAAAADQAFSFAIYRQPKQ